MQTTEPLYRNWWVGDKEIGLCSNKKELKKKERKTMPFSNSGATQAKLCPLLTEYDIMITDLKGRFFTLTNNDYTLFT